MIHMKGMDIAPGNLMKRIAQFRRNSDLTHLELSNQLGVPVCFTEILENGVLIRGKDGRHMLWPGDLFSEHELEMVARGLPEEGEMQLRDENSTDEFVFYCPVTVSGSAIERELQFIIEKSNLHSHIETQVACLLALKARLYHRQMCMCGRKAAADVVLQRVSAVLRRGMRCCR